MKKTAVRMSHETGIYVVCSDKALLEAINSILAGSGVIGMQDRDGGMHYVVDARSDRTGAAVTINEMVTGQESSGEMEEFISGRISNIVLNEVIRGVLLFYGFDVSHFGSQAIMILVRHAVRGKRYESTGAKEMYGFAARVLKAKSYQVERNVRYAVGKSRLKDAGLKSITLITLLTEAVKKELERRQKKSPDIRDS